MTRDTIMSHMSNTNGNPKNGSICISLVQHNGSY